MSARTRALLPRRRTATATAVLLLGALGLAGCTDDAAGPPDPPATTAAAPGGPVELTFGVFGSPDEVAGYDDMVTEFNSLSEESQVTVKSWRTRDEEMAELGSTGELPDVFLVSRGDLAAFQADGEVQPVVLQDNLRFELASVRERDLDIVGPLDHVVVGDDDTIRSDNHARAQR